MSTLKLKSDNALEAWKYGDQSQRGLLQKLYPDFTFSNDVMDIINGWDDVVRLNTQDPDLDFLLNYKGENKRLLWLQSCEQLAMIAFAFNEGKEPDWSNPSQWKYFPWPKILADTERPSGFGLSWHFCVISFSDAFVGSPLYYLDSKHAKRAFELFPQIFTQYFLNIKK